MVGFFFLNNKSTKVIYTDIQKDFDSVSHSKLIQTLSQYKIRKSVASGFKEVFHYRTQEVVIGNTFSESQHSLQWSASMRGFWPTLIYNLYT